MKALVGAYRSGDIDGSSVQVGDERLIVRARELQEVPMPGVGDYLIEVLTGMRRDLIAARLDPTGTFWTIQGRRNYGGTNFVQSDEITSSGSDGVTLGGGINVIDSNLIASTARAGLACSAGTNNVTAREIRSSAGYGVHHAFVEDPFTLTINQARIVSTFVAAGGKAVQVDGSDDLTLKDCVLVSSVPAATSIDGSAPVNVQLYGSTMANKAEGGTRFEVDANVR